jgi:diaminopimelate decarboxylase
MSGSISRSREGLCVEGVGVERIADRVGTPVFIYSSAALTDRVDDIGRAFGSVPHSICFAIKSNMNLAVVRTLVARGCGIDVTSGGELFRAIRAGGSPRQFVYSGVGKTNAEIDEALAAGIRLFNLESLAELHVVDARAKAAGVVAPVAFRVNPDVDPKTHPYISTGLRGSKFGIPIAQAPQAYAEASALEHVRPIGVACHIGSQLLELGPIGDALSRVRALTLELRAAGHAIALIDVGGGLGVRYHSEQPPSADAYAAVVIDAVGDLGCELLCEPGRFITANAGLFVSRVLYRKSNGDKQFVVIDGAMNDLIRPSLYQSYQQIEPVGPPRSGRETVDIVGPVCESADFLAKDRELPVVARGDLLAVRGAGAYSFAMSSNYNGRRRAAEVLVKGDRFEVVRERETYEDLIRGESIPEELTG